MAIWMKSTTFHDIMGCISSINQAVQGMKLSTKLNPEEVVVKLIHVFEKLVDMIDTSASFDHWFGRMETISRELLKEALLRAYHPAIIEVRSYFIESFRNAMQIGSGMDRELAFIMFLCAFYKIYALDETDDLCVGLKLFNAYLQCVRRLQTKYYVKPAVAMSDDQLLPYIWGSAQLYSIKSPFEPGRSFETAIMNRFKNEYYFIGCINHIEQVCD